MTVDIESSVETRARQSQGVSNPPIYRMVVAALRGRGVQGGTLVDVGCGMGELWPWVRDRFDHVIGVDVVRYPALPADADFRKVDLDTGRVDLPDASADVVTAVETIEHLENPRAFVRELARLVKPGGWVMVTTPNQLSLLSLASLLLRGKFNYFQDAHYPAHITALLEVDLRRIASECGLVDVGFSYSLNSRIPFTGVTLPSAIARLAPRALSDNLAMMARKPEAAGS